jgi:hypothetical protein
VLPAHDDQVPVAGGDAAQRCTRIALGRPDGDGDIARLAAGRSPERVTDQLRRRLTLLGPLEEHDYMPMRRVPVVAAAVPREAQCP